MAVISELGGEKIDIILWEKDPEKYIANSLSPAKTSEVKIEDKNTAVVSVSEDQLSLAIGKDGRNVRLASNLTGWKIDIKPVVKKESEEAKENEDSEPDSTESSGEAKDKPKKGKKVKKSAESKGEQTDPELTEGVKEEVSEEKTEEKKTEESPAEEKPTEEK